MFEGRQSVSTEPKFTEFWSLLMKLCLFEKYQKMCQIFPVHGTPIFEATFLINSNKGFSRNPR